MIQLHDPTNASRTHSRHSTPIEWRVMNHRSQNYLTSVDIRYCITLSFIRHSITIEWWMYIVIPYPQIAPIFTLKRRNVYNPPFDTFRTADIQYIQQNKTATLIDNCRTADTVDISNKYFQHMSVKQKICLANIPPFHGC